jgi:hypothetical protein
MIIEHERFSIFCGLGCCRTRFARFGLIQVAIRVVSVIEDWRICQRLCLDNHIGFWRRIIYRGGLWAHRLLTNLFLDLIILSCWNLLASTCSLKTLYWFRFSWRLWLAIIVWRCLENRWRILLIFSLRTKRIFKLLLRCLFSRTLAYKRVISSFTRLIACWHKFIS